MFLSSSIKLLFNQNYTYVKWVHIIYILTRIKSAAPHRRQNWRVTLTARWGVVTFGISFLHKNKTCVCLLHKPWRVRPQLELEIFVTGTSGLGRKTVLQAAVRMSAPGTKDCLAPKVPCCRGWESLHRSLLAVPIPGWKPRRYINSRLHGPLALPLKSKSANNCVYELSPFSFVTI